MSSFITSTHGNGGRLTHQLIVNVFKKYLPMAEGSDNDSCFLPKVKGNLVVTTDGHAIDPIIFPGGDIGKLSVTGTINDLLASGARPIGLSASFILNEGLPIETLEKILYSLGKEMDEHGMKFYSGDTKVVPASGEPGLYISTTGFGESFSSNIHPDNIKEGMDLICTGPIASHGVTILGVRNGLQMTKELVSDVNSLFPMMKELIEKDQVVAFRDATRGGLLSSLYEFCQGKNIAAEIDEISLPIKPEVKSACDVLGLQPLEVANEGVGLIVCDPKQTEMILNHLQTFEIGKDANRIGCFIPSRSSIKVHVKTSIGGMRAMAWTNAENLPRIC